MYRLLASRRGNLSRRRKIQVMGQVPLAPGYLNLPICLRCNGGQVRSNTATISLTFDPPRGEGNWTAAVPKSHLSDCENLSRSSGRRPPGLSGGDYLVFRHQQTPFYSLGQKTKAPQRWEESDQHPRVSKSP